MNLTWMSADRTTLPPAAIAVLLALHTVYLVASAPSPDSSPDASPHTSPDASNDRQEQTPGHQPPQEPDRLDIASLAPALGPIQDYGSVTERPLFDPTRTPPTLAQTPVQAEKTPAPATSQFTLNGIVIAQNKRSAILKNKTTSKVVRATEGTQIGDWKVETLESDRILLSHKGAQQEISLRHFERPIHAATRSATQPNKRPSPP